MINPYTPPAADASAPEQTTDATTADEGGPRGIRGWLLLNLIGVILLGGLCCVGLIYVIFNGAMILLAGARFALGWLTLLWTVLLLSAMSCLTVLAIPAMLRHDRRAPSLLIAFHATQLVFLIYLISVGESRVSTGSVAYEQGRVFGQLFWPARCVLWMFYYRMSERVKLTFVK